MANRVVMGELPGGGMGLRVSRPGHNVLNTGLTPKQVAFDSRWAGDSKILIRGTKSGAGTVNYGVTLPYIPKALVLGNLVGTNNWEVASRGSEWIEVDGGSPWDMSGGYPNVKIYNNRLVFFATSYTVFSYVVLRD